MAKPRNVARPHGRSCVKGKEVSSRSVGLVGKPAFGGEQIARGLDKKGGGIEPERCCSWGAGKASFRRRTRAPGLSKKEGNIKPERCCCWGARFGGTPKRSSVSPLSKEMQPAPRRERLCAFEVSNNNKCLVIKVQQPSCEHVISQATLTFVRFSLPLVPAREVYEPTPFWGVSFHASSWERHSALHAVCAPRRHGRQANEPAGNEPT